jgi:cell division protein FtsZ
MSINLKVPDIRELRPRITVFGVGGAGGNAVNNMITAGLQGVDFVVANTDAQALTTSKAERIIQMGVQVTEGLGAGSQPEVGRAAAEEVIDEIRDHLSGAHMVFVTCGMGGGTGTGAAPVIAKVARELGILTVGVVTKPFHFEGQRRMRFAEAGIIELQKGVDTQIIIPNQNLFRIANEKTTFADAFAMADQVLYSGVACITDLMVKEGLINLDFADVRAVMREMGKAMMGTGEADGEKRALRAAEAAISNPLIDDVSMKGARGLLISITGGKDLTLYEVDEAATRIREEVDQEANIIVGATFDEGLEGIIRVSVVATGIDHIVSAATRPAATESRLTELTNRLKADSQRLTEKPLHQPAVAQKPAAIDQAAHAAVAAALLPQSAMEEVTIRPIPPKPSLFMEQAPAEAPQPETPSVFIPPQPERVEARTPRMPRIDELPMPAQNAIRASRGELPPEELPEKRHMTLLQRLASVGLGRREGEERAPQAPPPTAAVVRPASQVSTTPRPHQPQLQPHQLPPQQLHTPPQATYQQQPPQPRPMEPRPADPVSDYAKRQAPQGLDLHGRQTPAAYKQVDDDQLDIPAFLRRQAN